MNKVGKKHIAIIAVLWAVAVFFYLTLGKGSQGVTVPGVSGGESVKVLLDVLDKKRTPSAAVTRDIFRPFVKPSTIKPPVVVPVVELPPEPPPEPAVMVFVKDAKFMGYVDKLAKKTIFIVRGQDVYIVKAGDVIEDHYRVADISAESVRLVDERTNEEAFIQASSDAK